MSADEPPIIDFSDFQERKGAILHGLMCAAVTKGFFYIKSHGISRELIDRAFACSARYFDQPAKVKAGFPTTDWGTLDLLGYKAYRMQEGDRLARESCIQKFPVHKQMEEVWPSEHKCPGFKETSLEFMQALQPLVDRIMSLFALGIGFPENFFKTITDVSSPDNSSMLDYTKHHSLEGIDVKTLRQRANRITAHTDESLITLLLHSPGSVGLESAAGSNEQAVGSENGHYQVDKWNDCPSKPGCVIVNIGDALQYWSDGLLKSNFHRVRLPREGEPLSERYSIAWFVWLRDTAVIQGPQKKYPPTTMREFMKIKGRMFEKSFHPDPKVYLANQHIVFGAPIISAAAISASAASRSAQSRPSNKNMQTDQ